jgi:hypothetical protein
MSGRSTLGLLGALCVLLSITSSARGDDNEEARKHFNAGVAYLQDPEGERFEEAYAEFKRAYELSKSSKVLGNLALCAMKLERDGEAIEGYRRYLAEVPDIDPDERKQAALDLQILQASAVKVTIELELRGGLKAPDVVIRDTRLPVRGSNIRNLYDVTESKTELVIRPGHHIVVITVKGRDRTQWDLNATPGGSFSHRFVLEPEAPRSQPDPEPRKPPSQGISAYAGPIVLMGVGGAALVASAVLGGATLGKIRALEEKCPDRTCPASSHEDDVDAVRPFVLATDITLLAGSVVTAAGLVWLVAVAASEPSSERAARPLAVGAACAPSGCSGSLRIDF